MAGRRGGKERGGKEEVVYSIDSQSRMSRVRQARQTWVQVLSIPLTCCGNP